jgi:hypothetical protein
MKKYKLSRDVQTVPKLWQEWTQGSRDDPPSVLELNETFQASWRSDQTGSVNIFLLLPFLSIK